MEQILIDLRINNQKNKAWKSTETVSEHTVKDIKGKQCVSIDLLQ